MKRMLVAILLGLLPVSGVWGQEPVVEGAAVPPAPYTSPQEESARQAIHRRAAWKAEQRRQRLEAYKWLGYSPSRPPASPLQFMGSDPVVSFRPAYIFPGVMLPYTATIPR